ncbi:MAG: M3 family metallopeptidase [Candidatus Neomarinimicrobiota bacterium]
MRQLQLLVLIVGVGLMSCSKTSDNPFFTEWDTPFQAPPFDQISEEHYLPALLAGIEREKTEIAAIVDNPASPTYANTIEAYEASGEFLTRVEEVFFSISGTDATPGIDDIEREYTPIQSQHSDDILLNKELFRRIKTVYEQANRTSLTVEQNTLLEKIYKDFVRNGADLAADQQTELRRINEELANLKMEFGQNIRKENNTWEMLIDKEADLVGLPLRVRAGADQLARERGYAGKWLFTLDKPSLTPFLQYSQRRDLRERIFMAYIHRGDNNDKLDNKNKIIKIVNLRIERSQLLGYDTYADYSLERSMAKTSANVYDLLYKLWGPAQNRARMEVAEMQAIIDREGGGFKLQPWDWWYYGEKLRQEKYNLVDDQLRPYFEINNVLQGAFDVASRLYGISFTRRDDIPVYNPDVKVYEVKEADGTHIGLLYTDYHPRVGKQVGAWCGGFRGQSNRHGHWVTPLVTNVCNFSAPTAEIPALISFSEVETLFHEFGHALHSLLQTCVYPSQLMPRDFVELPSQVMENWAAEPEVLRLYARHFITGRPIPEDLIEKIRNSRLHNQGFINTEYLAASLLDMEWHTLNTPVDGDPVAFENAVFKKIGLIPEIVSRYRSPYFNHVFSWGYSAGYYSYMWAQVLDADAFQAFKDSGDLYNQELAAKFRKYVLGLSGTEDAMDIYRKFRGGDPDIQPLLVKRGLN